MNFTKINPKINLDERGSLYEIYSESSNFGISPKHMYISNSKKGVVRGFHQQIEMPQKKLVFCLRGKVADFAIKINPFKDDFGTIDHHLLRGVYGEGVVIGREYAHGFECLSKECSLLYICDAPYIANDQLGINPLDKVFRSIWKAKDPILSPKDLNGKMLSEVKQTLINTRWEQ